MTSRTVARLEVGEAAASGLGMPGPPQVHVWRAALDSGRHAVARLERTLSGDERTRAGRFSSARDRLRFVLARGLLRDLLGRYLGVPPEAIDFDYGSAGKPELAWPLSSPPLRFNLSHSGGLALYAVTVGHRVGVDLEAVRPLGDMEGVSRLVFSDRERDALWSLPPAARNQAFFAGWVRKEAVLKAWGEGLGTAPREIEVVPMRHETTNPVTAAGHSRTCGRCTIFDVDAGAGYAAAVAVEGSNAPLASFLLVHLLVHTSIHTFGSGRDGLPVATLRASKTGPMEVTDPRGRAGETR